MAPLILPEHRFGATLESLLDRRERIAKSEGANFGAGRLFVGLAERVLSEINPGSRVLEIDAGAGLFTRLLLARECEVTAFEPVESLCERLRAIDNPRLTVRRGFVEDLVAGQESGGGDGDVAENGVAAAEDDSAGVDALPQFDYALVSFGARRGRGILTLINELLPLVERKILVVFPDDGSLDYPTAARALALEGVTARTEFLVDLPTLEDATRRDDRFDLAQIKKAILMVINARPVFDVPLTYDDPANVWGSSARTIEVPYPVPRGAATRLVRYFKSGGDRSILIKTQPAGMTHLYGNLRTAAHRIARDEVSVRRVDAGIQLMLVPQSEERTR